jgi:hypothetical protein
MNFACKDIPNTGKALREAARRRMTRTAAFPFSTLARRRVVSGGTFLETFAR